MEHSFCLARRHGSVRATGPVCAHLRPCFPVENVARSTGWAAEGAGFPPSRPQRLHQE